MSDPQDCILFLRLCLHGQKPPRVMQASPSRHPHGPLWGFLGLSLSVGLKHRTSPDPESRTSMKYGTHMPLGLICPFVCGCKMRPCLHLCPNDRGSEPLISPNETVNLPRLPHPSVSSHFGELSRGASPVPTLSGAPTDSIQPFLLYCSGSYLSTIHSFPVFITMKGTI